MGIVYGRGGGDVGGEVGPEVGWEWMDGRERVEQPFKVAKATLLNIFLSFRQFHPPLEKPPSGYPSRSFFKPRKHPERKEKNFSLTPLLAHHHLFSLFFSSKRDDILLHPMPRAWWRGLCREFFSRLCV